VNVLEECLCPRSEQNKPFLSLRFEVDENPSVGEANCLTIYEKLGIVVE
jgi:hypothetical protein